MILYEINLAQVSLLYYIKVFKFDRFYQFKYKLTQPRLIVNLSPSNLTISVKEYYTHIQSNFKVFIFSINYDALSSTSPNYISYVYVFITS